MSPSLAVSLPREFEETSGEWRCQRSQSDLRVAESLSTLLDDEPESSGESSDSSEDSDSLADRGFHEWLAKRCGRPGEALLVLSFMVLSAVRYSLDEAMWLSRANLTSMNVITSLLSLTMSVLVSFYVEGLAVARAKLTNWRLLWRFAVIAVLFQLGWRLTADAYRAQAQPIVVKTLGFVYLPLSAVASFIIFQRKYGVLEWLALFTMMLAMTTFSLLRERCRAGHCEGQAFTVGHVRWLGIFCVLASVVASCAGSIYSERIYKSRSFGLGSRGLDGYPYSVFKVYLDFCTLMMMLAVWVCPMSLRQDIWGMPLMEPWFGIWTTRNYFYIPITVAYWWMAGFITKRYSTVFKALVQTVASATVICVYDPFWGSFRFQDILLPSVAMLVIILLSALIFQTGRINIINSGRELHTKKEARRMTSDFNESISKVKNVVSGWGSGNALNQQDGNGICGMVCNYLVMIVYVLADATRTVTNTVILSHSMSTPQVFSVAMNFCMLGFSNVMLWQKPPHGVTGGDALREAWNWKRLLAFTPCGFFFALTSALSSMAAGMGISPTMSIVVGKIYLPVMALVSRFMVGKYYMWLEWFAIIILTLDSMAFGVLQNMGGKPDRTGMGAIIAQALSAVSSVMSSLVFERMLKSEPRPFMMQKLRSDFSCLIWSVVFLPVMGLIASPEHFAKGAFWRFRPLTQECDRKGACGSWQATDGIFLAWDGGGAFAYKVNGSFVPGTALPKDSPLHRGCSCGADLFVGWDNVGLFAVLAIQIFYGFITGLMVNRFGSVMRAIADNFSLLLVYTVGDPLFHGSTLTNMSLNLTALILPLSAQTFSQAATQLKGAGEPQDARPRPIDESPSEEQASSNEDSEEPDGSESGGES